MKKNIYKDVPEHFHNQFIATIEEIEKDSTKVSHIRLSGKRMAILIAATVAALSTLTVGAASLYKWHQAATERLGVSEEVANKLTAEGAAKEENAVVNGSGLTIEAVQSVKTDTFYYVLLSVTTPEGIVIDEDTLFDSVEVVSDQQFDGCVLNQVTGSFEEAKSLWEMQLLTKDDVEYANSNVTLKIKDLVQTENTEVTEILVQGEWMIDVTLPLDPDTMVLCQESKLALGHHSVTINKTEVGAFQVRLYGDQEELRHALRYQNSFVTGVRYQDGTVVKEQASVYMMSVHADEVTGEHYVNVPLSNAIDVSKFKELIFAEEPGSGTQESDFKVIDAESLSEMVENIQQMQVVYERNGHSIVHDGKNLYLWDEACDVVHVIANLENIGFVEEQGGTLEAGPGGKTVQILPYEGSEKMYISNVSYDVNQVENVYEMPN